VPGETGLLLPPTEQVRIPQSPTAESVPEKVIINGEVRAPRSVNPDTLAQTIGALLDDPQRRARLGAQAKTALSKRFRIDRYVQELEGIYLQLAQAKGLKPA
jgi:glycosyltransferase involved in cell wall biosynthesis